MCAACVRDLLPLFGRCCDDHVWTTTTTTTTVGSETARRALCRRDGGFFPAATLVRSAIGARRVI